MMIAIISDTHDNIPNIEKFLIWAKENKIEKIIHCGDVATTETFDLLSKQFSEEIVVAWGNMDAGYRNAIELLASTWPNIRLVRDIGYLEINKIKIAFCHLPNEARRLAESSDYQIIFYGHTHKPWMETLPNGCQLINPGTLGGIFSKATFAVFDTGSKKIELKVLELI